MSIACNDGFGSSPGDLGQTSPYIKEEHCPQVHGLWIGPLDVSAVKIFKGKGLQGEEHLLNLFGSSFW